MKTQECIIEKVGLLTSKYHNICDGTSVEISNGITPALIFFSLIIVILSLLIVFSRENS